ncbi:MAG: hypothetical protein KDD44_10315 [Bdellovibrionales bacterium]|nr:hypothetical protein [Bdellovibrionales bacterium]
MNQLRFIVGVTLGAALLAAAGPASAEPGHAAAFTGERTMVSSVVELARRGEHFQALSRYTELSEQERSVADGLAAARSAWSLGLVGRARDIWDDVFAIEDFRGVERARALLARAILEHQEQQHEPARAFAERGAALLEPSDLRAQFWLLIAESLRSENVLSRAEGYYERAAAEGTGQTKAEALYFLGEVQKGLGRLQEARQTFTSLPLASAFTARALKRLIEIDHTERDYDGVLTWIQEGLSTYPTSFDEPWVQYTRIKALLALGRYADAQVAQKEFGVKFSEKDRWYLLATAMVEQALSNQIIEGGPGATRAMLLWPTGEDE